jgi:hypothetical protein
LSVALAPLQLDGRVELSEVAFTPPGRGPVAVDGALVGRGDAIVADGLRVALAGEPPFEVRGRVGALDTRPRYELEIATPQAPEANALLASFAGLPDLLFGPLRFDGRLSGDVGGETPALDAARGSFTLLVGGKEAGGGRLVGVSLLRGTVDQLGALGAAALAAGRTFGGRDLQRFYGDEFEVIRGTFELAQGSVRTPDLQMVYRDYTVDLRGTVDLHDLALDLTGELSIDGKVDSALAESEAGERRVIPLAHVRGTVSEPRVELTAEAVARLAASWATEEQREDLEEKIDEALGSEGAGRQVFDALEGVLERRK